MFDNEFLKHLRCRLKLKANSKIKGWRQMFPTFFLFYNYQNLADFNFPGLDENNLFAHNPN
jgi:hypothetical protein